MKKPNKSPSVASMLQNKPEDKRVKQLLIDAALASLATDSINPNKPFEVKLSYPEVMGPDGKITTADKIRDSITSDMMFDSAPCSYVGLNSFGYSNANIGTLAPLLQNNIFLGYAVYSLLLQNGILNSICDTPATEMCREWIEFNNTGDEDKTEKIKELELEYERLNVKDLFGRGAFLTFGQGGCLIYPKLKGDEDNTELQHELFIDNVKIRKGDLEYIQIIEPLYYTPIRYITDNPFSKWFYKPEYYTVMGRIIHSSRVFKMIFNEAPNLLKPAYNFNGMPMMGMAINSVLQFEDVSSTIQGIINQLNLTVFKCGLQEAVMGAMADDPNASSAGASINRRMQGFNALRNNWGAVVVDKESEDIMNLTKTLTGLDKLLSQYAEFMCIIPKTPATELLGVSPQGFTQSGEFERKKWDKRVRTLQEKIFRAPLVNIMHMAMLNLWGEIDPDISFEFKPLAETNELEESTIRMNKATEAGAYFDRGILSAEEVRTKLSTDENSGWDGLETLEIGEENEEGEYVPESQTLVNGNNFGQTNEDPQTTSAI